MSKHNVLLNTYHEDAALRVGDFRLLPVNPKAPIIQSHPISNFSQQTYYRSVGNQLRQLTPAIPIFNVFTILKNTAIQWRMYVIDPSNINNPADASNITYVWKRNNNPIYELNRLNEGKGTPQVFLDEASVTAEVAGEYVCEVSNNYGTVTTTPFIVEVLDTDTNSMMFTNLVVNGDGAGGLDGWLDVNGSFQTRTLIRDEFAGIDSTIADYTVGTGSLELPSYPFNFSAFSKKNLFYPVFDKIRKAQPNFTNIKASSAVEYNANGTPIVKGEVGLSDYEWWNHTAAIPTVIANEDFANNNSLQGFFPSPAWIDKYNNNSVSASNNTYTLAQELDHTKNNITYFTQTRHNFLGVGGSAQKSIQQSINISTVSAAVDGKVAGLSGLTGQFFAYVGLAISRYEIKYTENGVEKRVNWYVTDLDNYRKFLRTELGGKFQIKPDKKTPIEITPYVDDNISITLNAYNESNNLVQSTPITTPNVEDLWAVKEKVFFPLILYPLFVFFQPTSNDITVFGKKYTTTDALAPLFTSANVVTEEKQQEYENEIKQIKESIDTLEEFLEGKTRAQFFIDKAETLILRAGLSTESGITQEALQEAERQIAHYKSYIEDWESVVESRRKLLAERRALLIDFESNREALYGESALHPNRHKKAAQVAGLDRNAAFFMDRYLPSFIKNGNIYPTTIWEPTTNENGEIWYKDLLEGNDGNRYRALLDPGASAFFAVGERQVIPTGVRTVDIVITMENTSPAITDTDPRAKGWTEDEIYNVLFNVSSTDPLTKRPSEKKYPLHKYREPRCAVTKIKYQLQPITADRPSNHITYVIPPAKNTVLGVAKQQLSNDTPGVDISTDQPGPFFYNLITPRAFDVFKPPVLSEQEQAAQSHLVKEIQQGLGSGTKQPQSNVPAGYATTNIEAKPKTSAE